MKFATIPLFFLISFCTFSQETFFHNPEFFNSKSLSTLASSSLIGRIELKKSPEFKLTESCLKNYFGSILQIENIGDLSSETINYSWYYNGEIINLEIKSSLIVKKPGIYAVDINTGEDINRSLEIQIGLTLPNSFELCRNDTLLIKPFGNESKIMKWLLPNKASVANVDSLFIPNTTSQNNGIYKLQSESLSGCSYESQTQVLIKDYVAFDIPPIIEFTEGELFSITPTYPSLTDSTEIPQTLNFSNSESTIWGNIRLQSYGEYFQIYSRKNLIDDFSYAKTTFGGNYTIIGTSNLGCSTEKGFVINVVKKDNKVLAELGDPINGRICPGVKNEIPIINKNNIPENSEFEVVMFSLDKKKSLKGIIERDTARFDIIPPSFFINGGPFHFVLKLKDSLKTLFVSKNYALGQSYEIFLGTEMYCDSVKIISNYTESIWFYRDSLINGANGSSYFASKKGTYFALLENSSFSRTGCA